MDKSQVKLENISLREFSKCGEVFVTEDGRFRWSCVLCGGNFQNAFLQHVLRMHIPNRDPPNHYNSNSKIRRISEKGCSEFTRLPSRPCSDHKKYKFCKNQNAPVLKKYNIRKDLRIHVERNNFLEYAIEQKRNMKTEAESTLKEATVDTSENCFESKGKQSVFGQIDVNFNPESKRVEHSSKPDHVEMESDSIRQKFFSKNYQINKTTLLEQLEDARKNSVCDKYFCKLEHPVNIEKDNIKVGFAKFSHEKNTDNSRTLKVLNTREKHVCEICGKESTTKYNLNNHIKLRHNLEGRKKYSCDLCTKVFVKEQSLQNHMKTSHLKEKPFVCNIDKCGRGFIDEKSLKNHQAFHTNERKFTCPKCGKKYLYKSKLDAHFKIYHVLGRIHQCKECNKSFYDPYTLRSHMICHTGEKPFACDECPAKFPRENALRWHKKVHSGIKDHICQICGRAYHLFTGLYAHMKTHGIKYNKKIEKGLISIEKVVPGNNKQSKVKLKQDNLEHKNVYNL